MPWLKVTDDFYDNEKVELAGNAATGLFIRCGAYSARKLTDGFIPLRVVSRLGRPVEIRTAIEVRLLVETAGGLLIPDYLEFNPSADEVRADRARARERQQRARATRHGGNGNGDVTP